MTRENEIKRAACENNPAGLYDSEKVKKMCFECFVKGAEWADTHQATPWHSVADGDLPKTRNGTRYLLDGVTCKNAYIVTDGKEWWVDYYVPMDNSWASQSTPTHWMEIPQLPKESEAIR